MKRIEKNTIQSPRNEIVFLGHSYLDQFSGYSVKPEEHFSVLVERLMQKEGYPVQTRTFARAGFTSAQLLCYTPAAFLNSKPKVAVFHIGENDATGSWSSQTGTAQSGTSNSIQLKATGTEVSTFDNTFVGNKIQITSGAGAGQERTIISYDGATKTATVDANWTSIPNNTSVYSIMAPSQAQQQKNYQALIKSVKYRAIGRHPRIPAPCSVWFPSLLPADGEPGQRFVVMNDNATSSGAAPFSLGQHANVGGDFSGNPQVTVWEFRAKATGVIGWGRVAINGTPAFEDGIEFVILNSTSYLNWASGGDSFNVLTQAGTKYAPFVPVRDALFSAAAAEGATYNDVWSFQSNLIYGANPETTQGSFSWNYADSNIHYNAIGHDTEARKTFQALKDADGVIESLTE